MTSTHRLRVAAAAAAIACAACITPRDNAADDDDDVAGGVDGRADAGSRPSGSELYHSAGYAAASIHGTDANVQAEDCRECHGDQLTGGTAGVSCDDTACHAAGWRTDCTFCHGGVDTATGAPPRDLDGTSDGDSIRFRAHTSHVTERNHAPFACTQCHPDATDVMTPGHVFDDTPGRAEVTFSVGLSAGGSYTGDGTCSSLYCHGNGVLPGSASQDSPASQCNDCHASSTVTDIVAWGALGGGHLKHLSAGIACGLCHGAVADESDTIVAPALHVNGTVETTMDGTGLDYGSGVCTGFCHGKGHFFSGW